MWTDDKIKSPTKDAYGLRLNLKSPESRRHYPPDDNGIHIMSSEYEIVSTQRQPSAALAQLSTTTTPSQPAAPPPPPPPPPFPSHLNSKKQSSSSPPSHHQSSLVDETNLPKIKNKYGAVSKTYIKKLSSIFNNNNQHSNSATTIVFNESINNNNNNKMLMRNISSMNFSNNNSNSNNNKMKLYNENDRIDEDHNNSSLSDIAKINKIFDNHKSTTTTALNSKGDDTIFIHDEKMNLKQGNTQKNMKRITDTKNENKGYNHSDLNPELETFSLPRISLNKTNSVVTSYEDNNSFLDNNCSKSAGTGTTRSSIATNVGGTHGRGRRRVSTSHYSTEKSGSSGYYGSNLYSVGGSSVEEHIYSEPIIIEPNENLVKNVSQSGKENNKLVCQERECNSLNQSFPCLENCLDQRRKVVPEIVIETPTKSDNKRKTTNNINNKDNSLPNSILKNHRCKAISLPKSDATIPRPIWPEEEPDDSLSNINLDSFSLNSPVGTPLDKSFNLIQLNSPRSEERQSMDTTFTSTNTNTDSGKGTSEHNFDFLDAIDYHQTTNVLINIRSKLDRLLEQHRRANCVNNNPFVKRPNKVDELEKNILSLKNDLENYLAAMNEKSEYELRHFSTNLSNDTRVRTVTKALDRSKVCRFGDDCYEVLTHEPFADYSGYNTQIKSPLTRKSSIKKGDFILTCNDQINPFTTTARDTVIQVVSDHSSGSGDSFDSLNCNDNIHNNKSGGVKKCNRHGGNLTQMQKNLALSQLFNDSFNSKYGGDKEKMLNEFHRDKPSIWEMYYGTNRYNSKIEQAIIREYKYGKKCAMNVSYPSTRPESDFTLDLPRAEQLRIKMEKEKQFRNRCRLTTYFLGLFFFLLTVMIVSLVLTRGKRMFGSML